MLNLNDQWQHVSLLLLGCFCAIGGVICECYIWGYLWVLYMGLFVSVIYWVVCEWYKYMGVICEWYTWYMWGYLWVLYMSVICGCYLLVLYIICHWVLFVIYGCYMWVLYVGVICECYIYESYLIVFSRARPYSFWLLR